MSIRSTVMNRTSFVTYSFLATSITGILLAIVYVIITAHAPEVQRFKERHAAWETRQKEQSVHRLGYERWKNEEDRRREHLRCEKALSGEPSALADVTQLDCGRGVVALRTLIGGSEITPFERFNAFERLLRTDDKRPYLATWTRTDGNTIMFTGDFEILNNPSRLLRLMSGDQAAVAPELSRVVEVPEMYKSLLPNATPDIEPLPEPLNVRWQYGLYLFASLMFAITFYIVGHLFHADNPNGRSNPFTTRPRFVLAYLILLAFLPGFAFMKVLYWMSQNIGNPERKIAQDPKSYDERIKAIEAAITQISSSSAKDHSVLQAVIEELKKTKSLDGLRGLEKIVADLERTQTAIANDRELAL